MPDNGGLSSEDLRKRAAVGTLSRTGNGPPDPLEAVLQDGRKIAAHKLMQRQVADTETAAIQAENERLKAEIERRHLEEAAQGATVQDGWHDYMLKELAQLREKLDTANAARAADQVAVLHERLQVVINELARLQEQAATPPDPLGLVATTVDRAQALMDKLRPQTSVPFVGVDAALEKWKLTVEFEREKMRLEAEERRAQRIEELKLQAETRERELELRRMELEQRNRFYTETGPRLIELGQQLLQAFQRAAPTPTATPPAPSVSAAAQPPSGAKMIRCQQCAQPLYYREEFGGVICPACGAEYRQAGPSVPSSQEATDRGDEPTSSPQ